MFGVLWTRSLAVGCVNIDREDAIRVFTNHAPAAEPATRNAFEVMSWVISVYEAVAQGALS